MQATFAEAIRRPERTAPTSVVEHGPTDGRRPDKSLFMLAIDRIRPDSDQVRRRNKNGADDEVKELAGSIRAEGIENPLTVRFVKEEGIYELIAGERRFTAAKLAGLQEGEELASVAGTLHALLDPRKRGIEPRADQPPLLG